MMSIPTAIIFGSLLGSGVVCCLVILLYVVPSIFTSSGRYFISNARQMIFNIIVFGAMCFLSAFVILYLTGNI